MRTVEKKKGGELYNSLLKHCKKQYKDIETIQKAYAEDGKIFGIDYIDKNGMSCISSGTAYADKVIIFI